MIDRFGESELITCDVNWYEYNIVDWCDILE